MPTSSIGINFSSNNYILKIGLSSEAVPTSATTVYVYGGFNGHYGTFIDRLNPKVVMFRLHRASGTTITFNVYGDYADRCYLAHVTAIRL